MIIGIDTSCYTTSVALVTEDGTVALDSRQVLTVKPGERGLRQSDAIFQHIQNLPEVLKKVEQRVDLTAVAVAAKPRPAAGSYLPVFKVAASFGGSVARLFGVPLVETSHQEGHLRAGIYPRPGLEGDFLAWHISGGTTDLLLVRSNPPGFSIEKIGGTTDLHVGQFVDRVGVALGAPFPAGSYLENLAVSSGTGVSLPVVTKGLTLSFSGPESAAQRSIKAGVSGSDLASQVFQCIGKSLFQVTLRAVQQYRINRVLLVGGVASNSLIKDYLTRSGMEQGVEIIFSAREYASDNAVGIALIGYDGWKRGMIR